MSIKTALHSVSSLYLSHKVIMGLTQYAIVLLLTGLKMTSERGREERRCSPLRRLLVCWSRQQNGAACLTLCQLRHTLLPFFSTFISYHSVYPAPYLSAPFVFKSSLTCPSSAACHHLVYNCFKALKRVLETAMALNLTRQPGIV